MDVRIVLMMDSCQMHCPPPQSHGFPNPGEKKTTHPECFCQSLSLLNQSIVMSSSVGPNCTELKQKYDNCFNKWYSEKFLKGDTTPECEELFKDYRACVMVG